MTCEVIFGHGCLLGSLVLLAAMGAADTQNGNAPRKVYVMRHGERSDFLMGNFGANFTETVFDANGNYSPNDLNLPETLPQRHDGLKAWRFDSSLTEIGKFEATLVGKAYKRKNIAIDHVFSSPSLRCVQTAAKFIEGYGKDLKIGVDPALFEFSGLYRKEGSIPTWMTNEELKKEGLPIDESYKLIMERKQITHNETIKEYYNRSAMVVRELLERYPEGNILIVGHGSSLDGHSRIISGKPPRGIREFSIVLWGMTYLANIELVQEQNGLFKINGSPVSPLTVSELKPFDDKSLLKSDEDVTKDAEAQMEKIEKGIIGMIGKEGLDQ